VDNALKVASNFQKTKKTLENEINSLKRRLEEQETKHADENYERLKFNEGSYWMSKIYIILVGRVLEEINLLIPQLEDLYTEFEDRIKNVASPQFSKGNVSEFNTKIINNSKKWYQQSMKETVEEVKDKFEKWQIDIQKNFEALKFNF
jgi:hypothetical protein